MKRKQIKPGLWLLPYLHKTQLYSYPDRGGDSVWVSTILILKNTGPKPLKLAKRCGQMVGVSD